jgi:hypothetical protein
MEQALDAAGCLLATVRTELAPGFWPKLRDVNARTLRFAIAVAITDGKAVPVPVRFGMQRSGHTAGNARAIRGVALAAWASLREHFVLAK